MLFEVLTKMLFEPSNLPTYFENEKCINIVHLPQKQIILFRKWCKICKFMSILKLLYLRKTRRKGVINNDIYIHTVYIIKLKTQTQK